MRRIYTRGGDQGQTSLAGGRRLPKDSPRIDCYGTVDELNACIGLARETAAGLEPLAAILLRVQHELFNLGASLATLAEDTKPGQPCVTEAHVAQLEREIDALSEQLPPLDSFVLPGGSRLNAELHLCRTVCRRAERLAVTLGAADAIRYLNRLSDALFVFARWANLRLNAPETPWQIR
ncbi:MAG: cob(I)yrinic acid a,c-diamide adenosyltransferase [Acidobacteria bacterium]|nr:cob(I)yrinic acid a,c-diamide adenosyltransferase [Acidobacteriota bacterium]